MRTLSRTVLLVALLVPTLAGCGDSDDDKAAAAKVSQAHTFSCRSFELLAGADGKRIAEELTGSLDGSTSFDLDALSARLEAVRAAAAKAGLTKNLSTRDYRRFRTLVDTSLAVEPLLVQLAEADETGVGSARITVEMYADANTAIQTACK